MGLLRPEVGALVFVFGGEPELYGGIARAQLEGRRERGTGVVAEGAAVAAVLGPAGRGVGGEGAGELHGEAALRDGSLVQDQLGVGREGEHGRDGAADDIELQVEPGAALDAAAAGELGVAVERLGHVELGQGLFRRGLRPVGAGEEHRDQAAHDTSKEESVPVSSDPRIAEVLDLWFASTDLRADPPQEVQRRWFAGGEAFDREIVARFGALFDAPVEEWASTREGALAAVIVLDQLSRNAFRGTPRAFAQDERARRLATAEAEAGHDRAVGIAQRAFLYMPFEHAEDIAAQDRSVALFRALLEDAPPRWTESARFWLAFAERHRAIVAQFGRFPGRNRALGRADTPEETAWVAAGGETYGFG